MTADHAGTSPPLPPSEDRAELLRKRRFQRQHRDRTSPDRFGVALRVAFGFGLCLGVAMEVLSYFPQPDAPPPPEVGFGEDGMVGFYRYPFVILAAWTMGGAIVGFIPGFLLSLVWRQPHRLQFVIGVTCALFALPYVR